METYLLTFVCASVKILGTTFDSEAKFRILIGIGSLVTS